MLKFVNNHGWYYLCSLGAVSRMNKPTLFLVRCHVFHCHFTKLWCHKCPYEIYGSLRACIVIKRMRHVIVRLSVSTFTVNRLLTCSTFCCFCFYLSNLTVKLKFYVVNMTTK